jgi:hypothetical protein
MEGVHDLINLNRTFTVWISFDIFCRATAPLRERVRGANASLLALK